MDIARASVADLFTVPPADWAAIQQRVSLTQLAQPLAGEIQVMLPHFPDLMTVCQQWQTSTFPGIIDLSRQLAAYAERARQRFTPLAQEVALLDPNADLPAELRTRAQAAFTELGQGTQVLSQACDALREPISNFHLVNGVVDTEISRYQDRLGFLGQPIGQATRAVDTACGRVLGDWSAIADDLHPLLEGQLPLTVAVLLDLNLQQALLTWRAIGEEVGAFQHHLISQPALAAL
ncbi:hypothetical protein [Hymenobacter sp. CRA2]|uniref:hypothetical protein n=1 Tax=Hymenobacter sp. CRA2 TaxID=1955620 RepID=UPI00098E9389|nr:hypothetical protein [Hymenobacter sp. CRA2]OON68226.1 hypothetical protein B0919_13800 [Hymenobacter sp. CRA2]